MIRQDGKRYMHGITFLALILLCLSLFVGAQTQQVMNNTIPAQKSTQAVRIAPLTETERAAVRKRIEGAMVSSFSLGEILIKEYESRPLVPCLVALANDKNTSDRAAAEAIYILGMTREPGALPPLRAALEKPLKPNMSFSENQFLNCAVWGLGFAADDATLNLLEEMATEDYWTKRNPLACPKGGTPQKFRKRMRYYALCAIANSGSERAVTMFTTREGVPADLLDKVDGLLKSASMRRKERVEHEKGISASIIQKNAQAARVAPLTKVDCVEVKMRIERGRRVSSFKVGNNLIREFGTRPLVPCLIELIDDKKTFTAAYAVYILGMTREPEAIPPLRAVLERPLKPEMNRREEELLFAAVIGLGFAADDAILDLLEEMATEDYWTKRNPLACHKGRTPHQFRKSMRGYTFSAIASSGSERALTMFTTGEGVPTDMLRHVDSFRETTLRRRKERIEREKGISASSDGEQTPPGEANE
jgi:HEAT repeat protein